jgi:hypothetical protein
MSLSIHAAFPHEASEILAVIKGTTPPEDFPSVRTWLKQCYNRPRQEELKMLAISDLLCGYGVEAIFKGCAREPEASYVNLGDPYTPTIVYRDKEFGVGYWGYVVEQMEEEK